MQEEKEKLTFPDDMVFGVSTRLATQYITMPPKPSIVYSKAQKTMVYRKAFLLKLGYPQAPTCTTRLVLYINYRPSTPIFNILENKYGTDWIKERRIAEAQMREEVERKRLRGKVYETRATLLRRFSEPVEPPPYWKMKRWANVSVLIISHHRTGL